MYDCIARWLLLFAVCVGAGQAAPEPGVPAMLSVEGSLRRDSTIHIARPIDTLYLSRRVEMRLYAVLLDAYDVYAGRATHARWTARDSIVTASAGRDSLGETILMGNPPGGRTVVTCTDTLYWFSDSVVVIVYPSRVSPSRAKPIRVVPTVDHCVYDVRGRRLRHTPGRKAHGVVLSRSAAGSTTMQLHITKR